MGRETVNIDADDTPRNSARHSAPISIFDCNLVLTLPFPASMLVSVPVPVISATEFALSSSGSNSLGVVAVVVGGDDLLDWVG